MPIRIVAWSLLAVLTLTACSATGSPTPSPQRSPDATAPHASLSTGSEPLALERPLRLVAVGDGYSVGDSTTAAPNRDSWPAQLQQISRHTEIPIRVVANLASIGQASVDVLDDQLPLVASYEPDIVVVQVGINDIITGTPLDAYGANLAAIFDGLAVVLPSGRIYALTTPDHRLTARGRTLGGMTEVRDINAVLADVAEERGVRVIDIGGLYELVADDPSFLVDGGPHPSARQFAGWAELIGQRINLTLSPSEP